jgi:hypothetical protein
MKRMSGRMRMKRRRKILFLCFQNIKAMKIIGTILVKSLYAFTYFYTPLLT